MHTTRVAMKLHLVMTYLYYQELSQILLLELLDFYKTWILYNNLKIASFSEKNSSIHILIYLKQLSLKSSKKLNIIEIIEKKLL